jgi:DNA-binding XRE family transcriptional regulator
MPGIWTIDARRKAKERSFHWHNDPVEARPQDYSKLRRVRVAKNVPQHELAKAAGVALSSYREIEAGRVRRPRERTRRKIARALAVSMAEIR